MTRRRAIRISAFLGIPILVIVAVILLWDWDWFIPFIDARASAAIGRPVTMAHLHVSLGRVTRVVADDVKVANPQGFENDPPLAEIGHLTIEADVLAYIRHRQIVLPLIGLDHPALQALATASGQNNYTLSMGGGNTSSASSGPAPQIGDIRITDGTAHVLMPKLKTDFQLAISTQAGDAEAAAAPAAETAAKVGQAATLPTPPVPPGQPGAAPATQTTATQTAQGGSGTAPAGNAGATGNATAPTDQAAQPHADTQQIVVDAKGTYAGQPITGRLIGGALLSLRDAAQPYPINLSLANGPTHVSLVGTVDDPLHFKGTRLRLEFAGPDMSLLYPLTGVAIPKTPAYRITGNLAYADRRIRFENFAGTVGNSDLEGTITEDPGRERPDVTADLHSRRIDLADLGGFIGTQPGRANEANESAQQRQQVAKAEASPKMLPQTPLNMPKIEAADVHLKYRGDQIEGRSIPLDNLVVALDIVDGRIVLHPVSFGVGTGSISMDADLSPQGKTIRAKADLHFNRVDVSRLMASTHVFQGAGTIGGQATIDTEGNSIATMLGNGNGGVDLYMSGGDLSALLVDISGLEFGNAILSALGVPNRAKVQCFVGQFTLARGVLGTKLLLLDTGEGVINGTGDINLRDELIDYHLRTHSKHFSVGSLPTTINLSGTFKHPSVLPGLVELGIRGGLAVGLGILAPPLALLPTIQLGVGNDNRCGEAVAQPTGAAPPAARAPAGRARRPAR